MLKNMKRIDQTVVRHMATLSRLGLTDTETATYAEQLEHILDYASHLPALDAKVAQSPLQAAADDAHGCKDGQSLLRNAVALQDGYVKVPAILDKTGGAA
mgnify:CR=1 FL=1